ncbi:gliding motility-associated ABC transporter substrate-binding protein GldG [Aequorivita marisscotiae]|uniref:Gliding motility-associated ABC transporter substrate-binding protein GldG n=1 Tax=Aequorivita marisscotiae TaxID=3040348 RepID=A0ABY8KW86_9FLAO|nr:gliding motility-associated ABC transporter substrate-binding protein GldG [Aequorivita sp. Ant34-E75]WGF92122.1 gliding motility-associated ABC transporter substrate-binding protein GldG [Aequorivita sp. Ant34-E75]
MFTIIKREINSFFSSTVGYLVIAVFLVINGLFLWVFSGNYNVLDSGFADLSPYFQLAPWVLLFLIPAVCMRAFSDEIKMGTLELLLTKPLHLKEIVLGKYFGAVILIVIALIPTGLYVLTISELGLPRGNWDLGSTLGSYIGLLFLVLAYTSIGVFASTLSQNQIVAFIIAVFLCFVLYYGFEAFASSSFTISQLGMKAHFDSVARGVLDTRDLVYFAVLSILFIGLTVFKLEKKSPALSKKRTTHYLQFAVGLILLIGLGNYIYKRFDLTQDKRFTLSEETKNIIASIDSPIIVDVFLKGDFPPEFKRLQGETEQLLAEFSAYNSNIKFDFINPTEEGNDAFLAQFEKFGLTPAQVSVTEKGKQSTELVYPWALAHHDGRSVKIALLKNQLGASSEERVNSSLQNLQYAFADGFKKLANEKSKKIAVLKGNGEYDDRYIADFFATLREYYFIAPFTLDSVASNPEKTLKALHSFDLIVAAQPTEAFSDAEKYVLDQYIMKGGKSLWLMDATQMQTDSATGKTFAFGKDLNLGDFFFKYGIRINPNLVKDVYSAPIVLASGDEREAQYNRYPWFFNPLSSSANNHPIVTNIEAVKFSYASGIDTLPNNIQKTVLLSTSPISKSVGLPFPIDFDMEIPKNLQVVNEGPAPGDFSAGEIPLAVLLEGNFTSVYKNRVKPISLENTKNVDEGVASKMVVISDGDVIKNQMQGNRPLELGFDKMTNQFYGNKEFLLNTVNYLLDDSGLINIRTRQIAVPFLDPQKTVAQRTKWQMLNILLPLGLLAIFGLVFTSYRKRKYTR